MLKKLLFSFFVLFLVLNLQAQHHTGASRSEIGFMLGGSSYIGDLNPVNPLYNVKPAGGLVFRYFVHQRLAWRINATYGQVGANDADSKNELLVNRNLSFRSDIFEVAGGLEFNYFPFQLGHKRYKGTAYLLVEVGFFHMNPQTKYNDEWLDLQPLGTEGQGTSLNDKKKYSLTQFTIPLGVGAKISLGKRAALSVEAGFRKTFTDYLDDVAADSYVDPVKLASLSGTTTAALSNRSLNGDRYGKRGTSSTKDWYAFFGLMLTFRLGNPNICSFSH